MITTMRVTRGSLSILLLLCSFDLLSFAQTFQAQVSGAVRDSTGAIVPNVKLTATNIATNVAFTTQSNEEGLYRFLALPPAQYKISAALTGFKTFEQGPLTLQVNDNITLERHAGSWRRSRTGGRHRFC